MIYNADATVNYLEVGRWMLANGYDKMLRVGLRKQLFSIVAARVAERDVLYVELASSTTIYASSRVRA
jgi:hypothetical protein